MLKNWQAIAESRLVAVLLLRDRLVSSKGDFYANVVVQQRPVTASSTIPPSPMQTKFVNERDAAIAPSRRTRTHHRPYERTVQRVDCQVGSRHRSESALNAAQRDDARAASDDRRKGRDEARASAMAELNATLSAISDEAFTTPARNRNGHHPPVQCQPLSLARQRR